MITRRTRQRKPRVPISVSLTRLRPPPVATAPRPSGMWRISSVTARCWPPLHWPAGSWAGWSTVQSWHASQQRLNTPVPGLRRVASRRRLAARASGSIAMARPIRDPGAGVQLPGFRGHRARSWSTRRDVSSRITAGFRWGAAALLPLRPDARLRAVEGRQCLVRGRGGASLGQRRDQRKRGLPNPRWPSSSTPRCIRMRSAAASPNRSAGVPHLPSRRGTPPNYRAGVVV
jgi:hypothetical protein